VAQPASTFDPVTQANGLSPRLDDHVLVLAAHRCPVRPHDHQVALPGVGGVADEADASIADQADAAGRAGADLFGVVCSEGAGVVDVSSLDSDDDAAGLDHPVLSEEAQT